jgi:hypothetical protein
MELPEPSPYQQLPKPGKITVVLIDGVKQNNLTRREMI